MSGNAEAKTRVTSAVYAVESAAERGGKIHVSLAPGWFLETGETSFTASSWLQALDTLMDSVYGSPEIRDDM